MATRMTEDATPAPCALQRVAGVTLLERHLRFLRKLDVREAVVRISGPVAPFEAVCARLAQLKLHVVLVSDGQALSDALSASSQSDWLVLDGSVLVDHRLPTILAERQESRIAVSGPDQVFAGCARLRTTEVQRLSDADRGLSGMLGDLLREGAAEPIDLMSLPTYVPDMRRDLAYYWHPIRRREDAQHGKQILLKAAQKGSLDWPAKFIHPRIESWIVQQICTWPITPNQVTLICNILAYFAAYHFAFGRPGWAIVAALCVGVLDGVDGRLARVKQLTSKFGGFIEHTGDAIYEYTWHFAIAYGLASAGYGTVPYMLACAIIGADMAEKVCMHIFERRQGLSLDDYSAFDRGFRLIVARRNTLMWTLIPFVVFNALYVGYWVLAIYALITLFERVLRVGFHVLYRPQVQTQL
ncbi:MAG: hypothetical protein ETSY2_06405 [Candidatus Entotheonella gemina]|uniref:Bifunctional IPC transferase and DIPP synthase n=3 Tax=Candidatus Entotheonella TaxID=93171 RepID=W4MEC3_9BACT|nr:MAG: hypothetical protein ETSY2_06405 [Candidatus Entotheonella gemina]